MKKILNISLSLLVVLSFSCEDYLEIEQLTSVTTSNYYSTPAEAETALVGCYDALQLLWSGGVALPVASTVMSDLTFGGTGAADADNFLMIDEFDVSKAPGLQNVFEDNWAAYYKGIFRCNTLIMNIDNIEWDSETQRTELEAEARFLRAFLYFDMVRMFENIVLLEEPSDENLPQSDPDDVYRLIVTDLKFAIEYGNETAYAGIADADHGHAHKWAAEALMARVYLYYTGYYGQSDLVGEVSGSDALGYVEDVITNGGFDLVPSFYDLWPAASTYAAAMRGDSIANNTYAGETNQEVIFAIKYTFTSDYDGNTDGNHWMVMNGLRNQSWGEYGYGNGWGACTVVPEVYSAWSDDDDRKSASIMAIAEEGIDYTESDDVKEYTGYFTKKYTPTADKDGNSIAVEEHGGVNFMIGQFQDYFAIRYSDVLLMAAELGSANAVNYVNQVRTRAGLEEVASVDKDLIFDERKYEFAFEGLRYWDLLRYDNSLAYASAQVTYEGTVVSGGNEVTKVIDGSNLVKTKGLFQIPYNQITLSNGVLKQNTGWE